MIVGVVRRVFDDGKTARCPRTKPHIRLKATRFLVPYAWQNYGHALVAEGDQLRVEANAWKNYGYALVAESDRLRVEAIR